VAPGTVLAGRYEVLAVLGRGGMGTVYSARDHVIDETVALKVLRPEIAESPEFAQRFVSEVRLARRVTHPNVCRIHEYGEDRGLRFLVMELVEGRDLTRVLAAGALAPGRALEIAVQAADALQAIHAAGIVHRDLKTANLMVDGAGAVKLMDFGIAKPVGGGGQAAAPSGYVVGTPEYMSPEQGRGRPVDARSDIYALGVVVYELFTGHVPFHADTPIATLMMHVDAPPPLDDPALPPPVVAVLRRALAKDPGDRFPTAKAMADALRGRGTLRVARASPHARRGVVLAALVLVGGWMAWRSIPATAPPPPEVPSPVLAEPSGPALPSPEPASAAPPSPAAVTMPSATLRPSPPRSSPATGDVEPSLPPPATLAPAVAAPSSPVSVAPAAAPPSTIARTGGLLVVVKPWADISIDGVPRGQTPLARIEVTPGTHQIVLTHPMYQPWVRRVVVAPGETARLDVDLSVDAVRRR
jgi:serine/threonine-protein kinase